MIRAVLFFAYLFVPCICDIKSTGANLVPQEIDKLSALTDPDLNKNVSQLISNKGYPVEEHTVQTTDGYLLTVIRIPYGKNESNSEEEKEVVLLAHGLLGTASDWILNFPHQSLGFILADSGYDVWLISFRGSTYSRNHVKYSTREFRFWNFSFDEYAAFDLPETIDYILDTTEKEALYLIGHSQGTTSTFAMLSEKLDYNDKIKIFIALAPVATLGFITSPVRVLAPFADELGAVVTLLTSGDFLPRYFFRKTRVVTCALDPDFCIGILAALGGDQISRINKTRISVYVDNFPSGSSVRCPVHYGQLVVSKRFCKYDYGLLNMKYYNQETPPEYDVSQITAPVALIWSPNDKFADTVDVAILRSRLTSMVFDYNVAPFNHFDFIISLDAAEMVYEKILQLLAKF